MMKLTVILIVGFMLVSCGKEKVVRTNTLSDFSIEDEKIERNKNIAVSSEVARRSYQNYLKSESDLSEKRKKALQRLAEIELDMSISHAGLSKKGTDKKSIQIFIKRLKEFPNDKDNDRIYYQLANAYAIQGDERKKINTLEILTENYPESKYYIESMFRLGESYLTKNLYIEAELALTSVIAEDKSNKYIKNALFKRAWSKYKQLNYQAALDDYNKLLKFFPEGKSKNRADQEFLNNIYKVYGICISYLGVDVVFPLLKASVTSAHVRYYIYENLSSLLRSQDRYLEAGDVYNLYLDNEKGEYYGKAISSLSSVWLSYTNQAYAMKQLIDLDDRFVHEKDLEGLNQSVLKNLSINMKKVSQFYHSLYQKSKASDKNKYLSLALNSYDRLLTKYKMIKHPYQYYLYAELQNEAGMNLKAMHAYEEIIRLYNNNKYASKAAVSLLVMANNGLTKKFISDNEYIRLNKKYLRTIDGSNVYLPLLVFSTYLYNNEQYDDVISLFNNIKYSNAINSSKLLYIVASSNFELNNFDVSESQFRTIALMKHGFTDVKRRLALSLFKQADIFKEKLLMNQAIDKYTQASDADLNSEISLKAQIEISVLYMRVGKWKNAQKHLHMIQNNFRSHKFINDVRRMLSIVYTNTNQYKLAAIEFEAISGFSDNLSIRRSSLLQSAELYEKSGDLWSAVKSYKTYINKYKLPIDINLEAKYKLTLIYDQLSKPDKRNYWLANIRSSTDKLGDKATDRMIYLASESSIRLAREEFDRYSQVKLTIPLQASLKKKKKVLKTAIKSLKHVNKYNMYEHVSESIYWIAETYYDFSKKLLNSERPKHLSVDELEQYNVLLEDQAIPFEDQAIRYFIQNIKASSDIKYSAWKDKSFVKLSTIYPSKYKRIEKTESQVNAFF